MLRFDEGENRFNFRSAALIIHQDHVLLHRDFRDDFWALPGGRVEFFETSEATVIRELKEELGVSSSIKKHLWYVENFYRYGNKKYHEIANYFLVALTEDPIIESEIDFPGIEDDEKLIFRWVPIDKVKTYVVKPSFLIDGIQKLPEQVQYIKFNELDN